MSRLVLLVVMLVAVLLGLDGFGQPFPARRQYTSDPEA
jgi:hypothetical protein